MRSAFSGSSTLRPGTRIPRWSAGRTPGSPPCSTSATGEGAAVPHFWVRASLVSSCQAWVPARRPKPESTPNRGRWNGAGSENRDLKGPGHLSLHRCRRRKSRMQKSSGVAGDNTKSLRRKTVPWDPSSSLWTDNFKSSQIRVDMLFGRRLGGGPPAAGANGGGNSPPPPGPGARAVPSRALHVRAGGKREKAGARTPRREGARPGGARPPLDPKRPRGGAPITPGGGAHPPVPRGARLGCDSRPVTQGSAAGSS